jgi:superfamily I DNA/RNA helicase
MAENREFYSGVYHVIGPPGTGKTTFLARQVREIVERYSGAWSARVHPTPVLICSLTRAAATEIGGRDLKIPRQCVGTLHAHCYRAIGCPPIVDSKVVERWNALAHQWQFTRDAFPVVRDDDFEGADTESGPETLGDRLLTELDLYRHRLIDPSKWPNDVARFADAWASFKVEEGVIDFTDMIANAMSEVLVPPGNPAVIMVDEAQDLSAMEYAVVANWATHATATIIVGDPWQALYTWRGADPSLFRSGRVADSHRRVLSQSYRVPKAVLDVASQWMRDFLHDYEPIEYLPRKEPIVDSSDIPGSVSVSDATVYDAEPIVSQIPEILDSGRSIMIQASCSYMLSSVIGLLRMRAIPFSNPWRKHRGDWNPIRTTGRGVSIVNRILAFLRSCPDHPERNFWSWSDVAHWVGPMRVDGLFRRGAKAELEAMGKRKRKGSETDSEEDPAETGEADPVDPATLGEADLDRVLDAFLPGPERDFIREVATYGVESREAVAWFYQRLLAGPKKSAEFPVAIVAKHSVRALLETPKTYVGTIHAFKGAEADVVFVFPDLSRAGFKQWTTDKSEERDSVVRLFYVAMTRSREKLVICRNATIQAAPIRREVLRILTQRSEKVEAAS